jgi:hypothetical protein
MVFELSTTNAFITFLAEIPEDDGAKIAHSHAHGLGTRRNPEAHSGGTAPARLRAGAPELHLIANSEISRIERKEFFPVLTRMRARQR